MSVEWREHVRNRLSARGADLVWAGVAAQPREITFALFTRPLGDLFEMFGYGIVAIGQSQKRFPYAVVATVMGHSSCSVGVAPAFLGLVVLHLVTFQRSHLLMSERGEPG
jgi:hypothetical protein